jgi:hypothetical protein
MINLEKLALYLSVSVDQIFIDGNNLKKNILNHMSQLNQFSFHIHSTLFINNEMNLLSKDDIDGTFTDFKNNQIISYVDYFLERKEGQCHIYSYPFLMKYYDDITNQFPGGLYPYVRIISLYDEKPFEHEFFIQIHKSFPYIEKLTLINRHAQNHKQAYQLINYKQNSSIVKYSYLTNLDIQKGHDDYLEEFLCDTNIFLCNYIQLTVNWKSLVRVTHAFTRDDMRNNAAKIHKIYFVEREDYSQKSLQNFFPFLKLN